MFGEIFYNSGSDSTAATEGRQTEKRYGPKLCISEAFDSYIATLQQDISNYVTFLKAKQPLENP